MGGMVQISYSQSLCCGVRGQTNWSIFVQQLCIHKCKLCQPLPFMITVKCHGMFKVIQHADIESGIALLSHRENSSNINSTPVQCVGTGPVIIPFFRYFCQNTQKFLRIHNTCLSAFPLKIGVFQLKIRHYTTHTILQYRSYNPSLNGYLIKV